MKRYFRSRKPFHSRKRMRRSTVMGGRRRHITRRGRAKPRNRVHTVVHRRDSISPVLASDITDQAENLRFSLASFPGTGPFQALYHQYRILKCKVEYIPCNSQHKFQDDSVVAATTFTPSIYTAINRTAAAFPATVTDFMSMNSCQYTLAGRYHKRYFTPCTLDSIYNSALATGYNPEYKQWVSMGYPSAPHFGLDTLLAGTGSSAGSFKYRRVETIWVQYKNRKPNTSTSASLASLPEPATLPQAAGKLAVPELAPPPVPINVKLEAPAETDLDPLYEEYKLKRSQLLNVLV